MQVDLENIWRFSMTGRICFLDMCIMHVKIKKKNPQTFSKSLNVIITIKICYSVEYSTQLMHTKQLVLVNLQCIEGNVCLRSLLKTL